MEGVGEVPKKQPTLEAAPQASPWGIDWKPVGKTKNRNKEEARKRNKKKNAFFCTMPNPKGHKVTSFVNSDEIVSWSGRLWPLGRRFFRDHLRRDVIFPQQDAETMFALPSSVRRCAVADLQHAASVPYSSYLGSLIYLVMN